MGRRLLILHGYEGSGPGHWQTWLAGRLRERDEHVRYPDLPDPFAPQPGAWGAALHAELAGLAGGEGERVVVCHSLASTLWLREAAAGATRVVCADDDACCPEGAPTRWGVPLRLPVDVVTGGGHLNPDAGFGPWAAMEAWCLGKREALAGYPARRDQ